MSGNIALEVKIGFVAESKLDFALKILDMQIVLPGAKDPLPGVIGHEILERLRLYFNRAPQLGNRQMALPAERHCDSSRTLVKQEISDVSHAS